MPCTNVASTQLASLLGKLKPLIATYNTIKSENSLVFIKENTFFRNIIHLHMLQI